MVYLLANYVEMLNIRGLIVMHMVAGLMIFSVEHCNSKQFLGVP